MATSDAQRKAVKKYQAKMKHISLEMREEVYKKIKVAAAYDGMSVNSFIVHYAFEKAGVLSSHFYHDAHIAGMDPEEYYEILKRKQKQAEKERKEQIKSGIPMESKMIEVGGQSGTGYVGDPLQDKYG